MGRISEEKWFLACLQAVSWHIDEALEWELHRRGPIKCYDRRLSISATFLQISVAASRNPNFLPFPARITRQVPFIRVVRSKNVKTVNNPL